ncbi:GIY-YIG nuclease family protein [Candidatus Kaiserbacteria bacterium]|nr:GIY-YIG nuclease family protein [Candidatus Kaiserbacteria bacterium]
MFYVYILECADATLYTGYTKDLAKRVKAHNESKSAAKYTKSRRPVTLRYVERYRTLSKALKREYELKHVARAEKLALIRAAGKSAKH